MDEKVLWEAAERMQGEIAAEIRVMIGEASLAQTLFTPEQRERRITAMKTTAAQSTSDSERHESWMKMHIDLGWVYGDQFDPLKKTHPNLKPWSELPGTVKSKARIFDIVAKTFFALSHNLS